MKILLLDIETAPNVVHCWGLFNQNIAINQIVDAGYTLCWAAKWLGEDGIFSDTDLQLVHAFLTSADAVITYNGDKFDLPTLNKEFIKAGLLPPAPYKKIDLYKTAKSQFKFASNKLDYVAQFLGVGEKLKHKGHDLWKECMAGDPEALKTLMEYNVQDVILLEKVYEKMKPWIKSHANYSTYTGTLVCTNCGSMHYHSRGYAYTQAGKYQRFQCQDCGAWFRGNKSEAETEKFIGVT